MANCFDTRVGDAEKGKADLEVRIEKIHDPLASEDERVFDLILAGRVVMESAEYTILALNLVFALGCGWPLATVIGRVSPAPARVFRYFALLMGAYLIECVAFSASMATDVLSVALAFVWGILLGRWFRGWGSEERALLRTVLLFSLYSSLPAVSFLSVPVVLALSGRSVVSVEAGVRFGIPAFVPWPVSTILGFSLVVVGVAVVLKVIITTSLARAFIRGRAIRACGTTSPVS